jgi:hypothetical protein
VLARGFGVAEVLLEQSGESHVRFRKIRIEGNGCAKRLGRPLVFLHSRQREPQQEMGQRIVITLCSASRADCAAR